MADNQLVPFELHSTSGTLTDANQIRVNTDNLVNVPNNDAQNALESLQVQTTNNADIIQSLVNQRSVSGRGFQRLNDNTFEIDENNLSNFTNTNTIYGAGINKTVTWTLPNETEIANSGEAYPIVMEFTHLGGTERIPPVNDNRVNLDLDSADTTRIRTSTGLMNLTGIDLLFGDVVVLSKDAAGQDWFANRSLHDPNTRILPSGTWEFHETNHIINSITAISTELNGVVVNAGDIFIIETGGSYFGQDIANNSMIVALVDSPGLAITDGEDWYVINDGESVLTNDQIAFFNQLQRTGTRFDTSSNVFVNRSNVIIDTNLATGTALNSPLPIILVNQPQTQQTFSFGSQNIQFSELVGGKLTLMGQLNTIRQQGLSVEPVSLRLTYGSEVFTFDISSYAFDSSPFTAEITIPNNDYTSILNTNPTVDLVVNYRGVTFLGSLTILGVSNSLKGTLHDDIVSLASTEANKVQDTINTQLSQIRGDIAEDEANFNNIIPRISPLGNINNDYPYPHALFLDSTGGDGFPTNLGTMSQVSANNPRFTVTGSNVFVAVIPTEGSNFILRNITQSSDTALDDSDPNVELGESRSFNNQVYFVYRVSGLNASDVIEVVLRQTESVVKWENDITNLQDDVSRIDAELEHALLNLPEDVVQVLENEVSVSEESSATPVASEYNKSLTSAGTQTIFYEVNPNTPSGGSLNSKPISENSANSRYRNKLVYIDSNTTFNNAVYVSAYDGTTSRDLIEYNNGYFNAYQFVPARSASTLTDTVYPAPSNRVSGNGIWQTIPTLTFSNGVPVPEADELFFTRNVPSSSTLVKIDYRGHANGSIFGSNSVNLPANQNSITFTLNDGSETATVEVSRINNQIRVTVTERVFSGLPTINDVEVILSYSETRTVPATPATTRTVRIESIEEGAQIFAFRRNGNGNLVIIGTNTEVDTGYSYVTLFGAGETGHITLAGADGKFLDYQDITPNTTLVNDLENHAVLPQFGLFSTQYTHATLLNLETQMTVRDDNNNIVNVGAELVLKAPDGNYWRLSIANNGELVTTKII